MTKLRREKLTIIALALIFGITACASTTSNNGNTGGSRKNLNRLKVSKEPEIRGNPYFRWFVTEKR